MDKLLADDSTTTGQIEIEILKAKCIAKSISNIDTDKGMILVPAGRALTVTFLRYFCKQSTLTHRN